jgi:Domain of unknown function (DUF4157)
MSKQTHAAAKPARYALAIHSVLQRCSCGGPSISTGECASCKRKHLLRHAATSSCEISEAPEIVHDVLRSSGEPLKAAARDFFESRFGHDFSRVRIHNGSHAAAAAESVHATAFTVGRDIVFGTGRYAPNSVDGRRLIAHELSHVLQQGFEPNSGSTPLPVIPSSHALEHQAEQTARQALSSGLVETLQPSAPSIARQPAPPDAGVPDAESALDAGTPPADAGSSPSPPSVSTASPGATPVPTPTVPAKHQCSPGKGNPCPTAPPKTVVPGSCPEGQPTSGVAPPATESAPPLPVIPAGRFGGDPVVTDFAEKLACCQAQRQAAQEVERRLKKAKDDVVKAQDEQAKKDQAAAIDAAVEALKAEHPELQGAKLKTETAKVTRQTKAQSATEAATKKEAALKAVTKESVDAVQLDYGEKIADWLSEDYRKSMEEALKEDGYGPTWQSRALAALNKEKDEEKKKLSAKSKPKPKRTAKPKIKGPAEVQDEPAASPAPLTAAQIDEQIEAMLVRVRCEKQVWIANQLESVKRAWMVGRREQVDFATIFPAVPERQLNFGVDFKAPDVPEDERVPIPDHLKENVKGTYPNVAPELVSFLERLQALEPRVKASNYRTHGSFGFVDRVTGKTKGFSVDLTLEGKDASADPRGFYLPAVAIRFLLHVDTASKPADAEWAVQYNDFSVAQEVNKQVGVRRVGFTGNIDKSGSLNWHGPAPLKLHFHLDYMPKKPDPEAFPIRIAHGAAQILQSLGLGPSPTSTKPQGKTK